MTHAGPFNHPFMYWVGMDTDPRTTPEALAEFNHFYSTKHVHKVIAAHPGFVDMCVPPATSETDVSDFNRFYTETHVPEVMAYGGYARATRFELYRGLAHPEPGAPRFVAVYEADAAATEQRQARREARGKLSSGPPAWEAHDTLWRRTYRYIPPPD